MPKYARLNERTGGEGTEAWQILFRAWQDKLAGKKPIIMAVGDPDFNTPQPIIEAAKRALDEGHTHYAQIPGIPELREAVAREMMRVSGFSESEGGSLITEVTAAAKSFKRLSDQLAGKGMRDLEALVSDGRRTLANIDRVMNEVQRNPTRLLTGQSPVRETSGNRR